MLDSAGIVYVPELGIDSRYFKHVTIIQKILRTSILRCIGQLHFNVFALCLVFSPNIQLRVSFSFVGEQLVSCTGFGLSLSLAAGRQLVVIVPLRLKFKE